MPRGLDREENFAFAHHGVLLIGINRVGGAVHDADEWKRRQVQVDQGKIAPPVKLTVTSSPRRPFVFDRRLDRRTSSGTASRTSEGHSKHGSHF